jgi:hypothetical protein
MLVLWQNFKEEVVSDEEVEVHGGTDRLCASSCRDGNTSGRGLPEDGDCGADVFPVEEEARGLGVSELPRLRQLEEENRRLKRLVADLTLDKQMLQDVLSKKF